MKMNVKRIVAAISATAMLITSSIAANVASASDDVMGFPFPFEDYVGEYIPAGDYAVEGAENIIYHIVTNGADSSVAIVRTEDASDGARSLRIRGADTAPSGTTLCTEFTIEFGEEIVGETYEVSFDAWREASDWRDYAAINYEGWDGASRLTGTTKWTVEELGLGQDIGGVGSGEWSRYTASFTTDIAPQLNFAVAGWGELHIDNIIVKDSSGNVVLAESFEPDESTEPDEPDIGGETGSAFPFEDYVGEYIPAGDYAVEGAENIIYHIVTNGADSSVAIVRTEDASDGARSLRIRGADTAPSGTTLCTEFTIEFGEEIVGETYEVSFDAWREASDWRDYAAINYEGWDGASRLTGTTKWTVEELGVGSEIGGVGSGEWSRYTASFTTDIAPQLNFAVAGWGELHIDNIVVKDSSGNVIFAESFEPYEPDIGGETDSTFPFEDYIDEYIPVGDYAVEGTENVIYHIVTNGADSSVAIVRTADASDGARSLRIRGADTAPSGTTLCTEFTIEFGEEIVGETYEVSFDAWREASDWRDYAAINYEGWDGASRLTGTTKWTVEELGVGSEIGGVGSGEWSRYTASFTTDIAPQLNFAVAGWGELHIDNIVVKDSSGNVVLAESFEAERHMSGVGEYYGYGLYVGDELAESIEGSTTYTAKVSIVNGGVTAGINAQIFAILRKDGELVDISGSDLVTVKADKSNKDGVEVSTTITVGDISDGEYEISVYLWDGLRTMKILSPSKQYKESK